MSLWQTIRFSVEASRLGALQYRNPRRIESLARRRLRRLVNYAALHSEFYRHKFKNVDLAQLDLRKLPPTRKTEIAENFDRVVTDPQVRRADIERFVSDPSNLGRWYLDRYAVSRTSGSDGPPLPIVQNRRALQILFAMMGARANAGRRPTPIEGVRRLLQPSRIAIVASRRGFYPSGAAFEFMPELMGSFVRVLRLESQQEDLFKRLRDFQPNVLVAYASVLDALSVFANRMQLKSLRQIGNSSEQLTTAARKRIELAFNAPVLDHYGIGECLFLSEGCPTNGGAHVNSDWAILEVIDELGQPVPDGQAGHKVLVTNLANYVQPFIRYEVDDQVTMANGPCRCGSRLPRIARIDGRLTEAFWINSRGGRRLVPGVIFHTAADAVDEIAAWQAVQQDRNHVELRIAIRAGAPLTLEGTRNSLRKALVTNGLPEELNVEIRVVPSLHADARTGKLRRMVSWVGQPQGQPDGAVP
jgi:phenylacetate-CoA ligase